METNKFKYWKPEYTEALTNYILMDGENSSNKRRQLFNDVLYVPFTKMCIQVLNGLRIDKTYIYYDDHLQDLLVYIYTIVLPNISKDKTDYAAKFIYLLCRSYAIKYFIKRNESRLYDQFDIIFSEKYDQILKNDNYFQELDFENCENDIGVLILKQLDTIISKQNIKHKQINKFILLLKEYVIENNFKPTGFRDYCLKEMKLTNNNYMILMKQAGIVTGRNLQDIFKSETEMDTIIIEMYNNKSTMKEIAKRLNTTYQEIGARLTLLQSAGKVERIRVNYKNKL